MQDDPINTYLSPETSPPCMPHVLQTVPFPAAVGAGATGALASDSSENRPPTTGLLLKVMPG
jgi:hypothetical protein